TLSLDYLSQAANALRSDLHNEQDLQSRTLLARGALLRDMGDYLRAEDDLDEARNLAIRYEMPIAELEAEIELGRLVLAKVGHEPCERNTKSAAAEHLAQARYLIHKTRAYRRWMELQDIESEPGTMVNLGGEEVHDDIKTLRAEPNGETGAERFHVPIAPKE